MRYNFEEFRNKNLGNSVQADLAKSPTLINKTTVRCPNSDQSLILIKLVFIYVTL